jgi:hypothetical protein
MEQIKKKVGSLLQILFVKLNCTERAAVEIPLYPSK